ncbi:hypothetical protein DAPPUDRAFT_243221 [Daphnia pulex]|uniref:Uncharacterized protein n=1 Tax=Daphnia pulex TaxID=6669 RepID=E9GI94_DAPPU|nr:hypothetical protein DAPPUDRAFT_243221 [Daphnia pulex]|eukprot:EFX80811.1 hypothetical protein DAPPUDRAFT_243221 [Daphnia pulex]
MRPCNTDTNSKYTRISYEVFKPIPSTVNLKKERPVCISFTLDEGHGDHYVKLACGGVEVGPIPQQRHLQKESCYTEVPEYCTKAPGYYTTTYAALSYYTESPQYCSSPSYTTKGSITTPMLRSTAQLQIMERKGERNQSSGHLRHGNSSCSAMAQYYTITYVTPRLCTKAPECYTEGTNFYTTKALEYYTTTYHVNYGGVLLLGVVSLMAGSTTGVPMSSGYGDYQTSTSAAPAYYTEALKCYSIKAPVYYSTAHVALSYYAECPKYFFPSYTTEGSSTTSRLPSTTSPRHRSTKTVDYYTEAIIGYYTEYLTCHTTEAPKYCTTTYVAPAYTTKAAEYYTTKAAEYYTTKGAEYYTTKAAEYYTTKAAEYYTTKAAEYYTTKAAEYYTTKAAEYYTTKGAEYYTTKAAEYYTTKAAEYYTTKAAEYYTTKAAANSYYTTKANEYYTTSYASTTYYIEAPKFYS